MRIISLILLVLFFAVTPVVLLETMVMPQLEALQYTYSNFDQLAEETAPNR